MRRLLTRAALGAVGVLVLAGIAFSVLVWRDWLPLSWAERIPFLHVVTLEGDVRMTDGTSMPPEPVTVEVRSSSGDVRSVQVDASENYHYRFVWIGLSPPFARGETLRIRATMPWNDLFTDLTTADDNTQEVLLADLRRRFAGDGADGGDQQEVFQERRLQLWSGSPPEDLDGWKLVPLAALRNVPDVQVDDVVRLLVVLEPMKAVEGQAPITLTLPAAPDFVSLRTTPLGQIGTELARVPFQWDKRQLRVPLRYTLSETANVSVHIYDAVGREIRYEFLGVVSTSRPRAMTWEWDGRDQTGQYAPTGPYTFVARANSLGLTATPKEFVAEIDGPHGRRVRYGRFTSSHTVGDLLDAFGLMVDQRAPGPDGARFVLRDTVRLYPAVSAGEPERRSETFTGDSPIGVVAQALGLTLDPVVRGIETRGEYRLVVRGAQLRGRISLEWLRTQTPVASQDAFLQLQLSQLDVRAQEGRYLPLADYLPMELVIERPLTPAESEDWQRTQRTVVRLELTGAERVAELLAALNELPNVSAAIRGGQEMIYQYDARLSAPNGAKFTVYRVSAGPANRIVANIRAAGVLVEAQLDNVPTPIPGDGSVAVPIRATVIGAEGRPLDQDTVTASASEGEIANRGYLRRTGSRYEGQFLVPETETDTTVRIEVSSKTLQTLHDAESADGRVVFYKDVLQLDVVGVPKPLVEVPVTPTALGAEPTAPEAAPTTPEASEAAPVAEAPSPISPEEEQAQLRKIARVYAKMTPQVAADLLLSLPPSQARNILLGMSDRDAAKIIDALLSEDNVADPTEREARRQQLVKIFTGNGRPPAASTQ
ncbi:MAG: hypothetical protein KatS3mg115_1576 [Candidatus Poribacteria bacterium]|nr:MAG: hypothetical protein KatS3mg115_1576 [Candidatus Poribacteria bacterium]